MNKHPSKIVCLLLFWLTSFPSNAQYKCKQDGGSVIFQQTPCPAGAQQEKIQLHHNVPTPVNPQAAVLSQVKAREDERRRLIQEAIANGRPMVSMTGVELERAMGTPDKINAAQYGSSFHDQVIYYRNGRTLYVYLRDGVVTSIQHTEGTPGAPIQAKPCPSAAEIRNIEFDISKISNRHNQPLQLELHKRLMDARACR